MSQKCLLCEYSCCNEYELKHHILSKHTNREEREKK